MCFLPGIMPVTNVKGLKKMADACGAVLPRWMIQLFEGLDDDPETRRLVTAVTTARRMPGYRRSTPPGC